MCYISLALDHFPSTFKGRWYSACLISSQRSKTITSFVVVLVYGPRKITKMVVPIENDRF